MYRPLHSLLLINHFKLGHTEQLVTKNTAELSNVLNVVIFKVFFSITEIICPV